MEPALLPFEARLAESWPPSAWQDLTVLLAVSGGADSVALLRGIVAFKNEGPGRLIVAHYNHRLRGAASDDDAAFVERLAVSLGLSFVLGSGDAASLAQVRGQGIEDAAREQRMAFYRTAAEQAGARYVATAHTADDRAETILHRILRGAGPSGLNGISRVRPLGPAVSLIRPLLAMRRAETHDYLATLGQLHCHDASNDDLRFTRNRLRHDLLPKLAAEYNPQIVDALLRLGAMSAEVSFLADRQAEELLGQAAGVGGDDLALDCGLLSRYPPALVKLALRRFWTNRGWPLRDMGEAQWRRLAELAAAPSPLAGSRKIVLPGNVPAERDGDIMRLGPRESRGPGAGDDGLAPGEE